LTVGASEPGSCIVVLHIDGRNETDVELDPGEPEEFGAEGQFSIWDTNCYQQMAPANAIKITLNGAPVRPVWGAETKIVPQK
jgi:hypothetical protein